MLISVRYCFFRYIFHEIYKQYQIIISSKIIDMNNQNSDISYGSSDQESQDYIRPRINNNRFDINDDINQTAVSFKEMNIQDNEDDCYFGAAKFFSKFYNSQLVRNSEPVYKFYESKVFEKYKDFYKIYFPKPQLYFLPITILFNFKIQKMIDLRDNINWQFRDRANVQIPKDRPDQIQVTIHDRKQMCSYIIRSNPIISKYKHKMPQLLDPILSLNPLFEFYEVNFEKNKFSQTCGIFMYWAYLNRILSHDYLSESAIKIIVIVFFLINQGAPNIITQYIKVNQKLLNRLQKLYRVNKRMQCQLEPQLFGYYNFTLMEKKSFYHQSTRKFSTMIKILPIPYPVTKQDIQQFSDSYKSKQNKISSREGRQKPHFAVIKFFKIMQYLQNCIKRSQKVVFDIGTRKGVSTVGDIDFSLEVKHPIFGNNLCQKLITDTSKLRVLKQQIGNVVSIYKKSKSKPMQALTKIFEKI